MVKKVLSVFLCLVMCLSVFSTSASTVLAAGSVGNIFAVKGEAIDGDFLSYRVSITKDQKNIAGIILNIEFDSTVLNVVECTPGTTKTAEGNSVKNFEGSFVHGVSENNPGVYAVAYTNSVSVTTEKALTFFDIKFKVIDERRPTTDVKFYCKEYYSTTETEKNITVEDGLQLIEAFENISTLAKPKLKTVEPCQDGLKVTWEPVKGALGYIVKRSAPETSWETLTPDGIGETEYRDTSVKSGVTYTYTVVAFNNYGMSLYDAVGISCEYVEKPVINALENAVEGVKITWGATDGADFYNILRREQGQTQWKQIAKRSQSADTTYVDTDVVDGVTYEYDVNSATDTFVSATAETGAFITYVAAPNVKSVENTLAGIKLQWSAHEKATHYIIYRKYVGFDSQLLEYAETTGTTFVDTNVVAGKSYIYSVKACTNYGTSAYNTHGFSAIRVPSTEVTSLSLQKDGVKIVWSQISGINGYVIYRKPSTGSNWTKVTTVDSKASSYVDTGLSSGAEYCYAVCPVISVYEGAKIQSDAIYYIKAPTGVTLQNLKEGIELKWNVSNGALNYEIWKGTNSSSFIKIATVSEACYLDEEVVLGGKYIYAIKALAPKGDSILSDNTVEFIRIGAIGKATPTIAQGGIMVTWEIAPTADSYAVFRNVNGEWEQIGTALDAVYLDENVISNVTYSYAVAAIIGESRGIVNTDAPEEIKYIAPPSKLTAANGLDSVTISWSAVDGAISYYVYRNEAEDSSSPDLIRVITADSLSYTDKDVECGETFVYTVRANDGEKLSTHSEAVSNMYLDAPVIKSIARDYTGVTFSWNKVVGAEGYRVYRKAAGATGWTYIETVGSDILKYTDTGAENGKRMHYAVRAQSANGISTYISKSVIFVAAPKLTTSNVSNGIQLKWDANPVADSYRIYRKVKSTDSWAYQTTVKGTSYLDKTAKAGTTYRYTIKANYGGVYSYYKTSGWAVRRLTTPVLKEAKNGNGFVLVTWNKVAGATGYRVYRKANDASSWTYLGNVGSTSFKDKDVKNKINYTYTIRAYYGTSLSSFNSKGVSVKYLLTPTVTSVANKNGYVEVQWGAVSGASSYYVYRKAGSATSWTRVATVSKTSYTDKNVKSGTNYRYTVKAYGSKTLSGYNSTGWVTKYLSTPEMVSAKSYSNGIVIKWTTVKGATEYGIYRKTGNGLWEFVTEVDGNKTSSYRDKTAEMGVKYTYTVRAHNGKYKSWFENGITLVDKY